MTRYVLPRAGVIGAGTGNIPYCSGAPPEGGTCAAEAHIGFIVAHSFNGCNGFFALAKAFLKPAEPHGFQTRRLAAGSCGQKQGEPNEQIHS